MSTQITNLETRQPFVRQLYRGTHLQVAGCDTLDLQVLAGVTRKLQHLGRQVLEDGSGVHGGRGTDTLARGHTRLEETVDTTHRELCTWGHTKRPRQRGEHFGGTITRHFLPAGRHATNATGGPSCRWRPCHPSRPCPYHPCLLRTAFSSKGRQTQFGGLPGAGLHDM